MSARRNMGKEKKEEKKKVKMNMGTKVGALRNWRVLQGRRRGRG